MKSKILFFLLLVVLSCGEGPGESPENETILNCRLVRQEVVSVITITYDYDAKGRLIKTTMVDPNFPRTYDYEYDVFGNPKSVFEKWDGIDESERTFTYGPDSIITEATLEYFSPAAMKHYDYTYNSKGQLTRIDASAVQCTEEYYLYEYTGNNITESTNVCGATSTTVTYSNFDSKLNPLLLYLSALSNKVAVANFGIGKNNARARVRETATSSWNEDIVYTYNDKGLPTEVVTTTSGEGIDTSVSTLTYEYECDE